MSRIFRHNLITNLFGAILFPLPLFPPPPTFFSFHPLTRSRGVKHLPLEFAIVVCHAKMVYTLFKNRYQPGQSMAPKAPPASQPEEEDRNNTVVFRRCVLQGRKTRARSVLLCQIIRFYIYNSKALLYLWCTQTCFVARYYLWLCRAFIRLGAGWGDLGLAMVYVTALLLSLLSRRWWQTNPRRLNAGQIIQRRRRWEISSDEFALCTVEQC